MTETQNHDEDDLLDRPGLQLARGAASHVLVADAADAAKDGTGTGLWKGTVENMESSTSARESCKRHALTDMDDVWRFARIESIASAHAEAKPAA